MARNTLPILRITKVVRKLCTFLLFASNNFCLHSTLTRHVVTQFANQLSVLRKALHQDLTSAIQHRFGVRKALLCINKAACFTLGGLVRVAQQQICQRLNTSLTGDLRFGAALLFVREVKVFQSGFVVCTSNLLCQLVGELALLFNGFNNRFAAIFHLTHINQALFQRTQLRIIQSTCRLFTVTRNKRNRRPFIQQLHRRIHLPRRTANFTRNTLRNPQSNISRKLTRFSRRGRSNRRQIRHSNLAGLLKTDAHPRSPMRAKLGTRDEYAQGKEM